MHVDGAIRWGTEKQRNIMLYVFPCPEKQAKLISIEFQIKYLKTLIFILSYLEIFYSLNISEEIISKRGWLTGIW